MRFFPVRRWAASGMKGPAAARGGGGCPWRAQSSFPPCPASLAFPPGGLLRPAFWPPEPGQAEAEPRAGTRPSPPAGPPGPPAERARWLPGDDHRRAREPGRQGGFPGRCSPSGAPALLSCGSEAAAAASGGGSRPWESARAPSQLGTPGSLPRLPPNERPDGARRPWEAARCLAEGGAPPASGCGRGGGLPIS